MIALVLLVPSLPAGGAEEPAATAAPDQVVLRNGDRLSGRLQRMTGGVLAIETAWGTTLELPFSEVSTLSTERAVTVVLADGEQATGRLLAGDPGLLGLALDDPPARPVRLLPLEQIVALEPPPPASPVRYRAGFGVNATLQRGNSWHTALGADAQGERKTARDRSELRWRWQDAQEERRRISSSRFGALKHERSLANGAFAFAAGEALSDRVRGVRLRSVASVGAGYNLVDREDASLALEAGLSYLWRDFVAAPDRDELTVRLAGRLRRTLWQRLVVQDQLTAYPSFSEGGVQLRNELEAASELFLRWALKVSYVLEYDSLAPAGVDSLDHLLVIGLQYSAR